MDEDLLQYLKRSSQPVPYHLQVNMCHDISVALSYLHAQSIVHRSISSDNILIKGNGAIKLGGFGVSIVTREVSSSLALQNKLNY